MLEMKQKIRSNFSSMSINYQILIVIVKLLMILHKSDLNFCQNVLYYFSNPKNTSFRSGLPKNDVIAIKLLILWFKDVI